jgi:hypothetical protein
MAYARGLFRYTLDEMDTFIASLSQCVVIPMHEHAEMRPVFLQPATVPVNRTKPLALDQVSNILGSRNIHMSSAPLACGLIDSAGVILGPHLQSILLRMLNIPHVATGMASVVGDTDEVEEDEDD